MKRLLVILSVLVCMMTPRLALADEVDILGGFTSGLSDFVSEEVRTVEVSPESDFDDEYEPVYTPLRSGDEVAIEEGSEIQSVVNATNTIPWGSTLRLDLVQSIVRLFSLNFGVVGWSRIPTVAAGIVFMWWGVRKAIRMVFSAFRAGKSSV